MVSDHTCHCRDTHTSKYINITSVHTHSNTTAHICTHSQKQCSNPNMRKLFEQRLLFHYCFDSRLVNKNLCKYFLHSSDSPSNGKYYGDGTCQLFYIDRYYLIVNIIFNNHTNKYGIMNDTFIAKSRTSVLGKQGQQAIREIV